MTDTPQTPSRPLNGIEAILGPETPQTQTPSTDLNALWNEVFVAVRHTDSGPRMIAARQAVENAIRAESESQLAVLRSWALGKANYAAEKGRGQPQPEFEKWLAVEQAADEVLRLLANLPAAALERDERLVKQAFLDSLDFVEYRMVAVPPQDVGPEVEKFIRRLMEKLDRARAHPEWLAAARVEMVEARALLSLSDSEAKGKTE
jgi:hypothetical protein